MIDAETLTILRNVSSKGAESIYMPAAITWLRETLSILPMHGTWTTRQLYEYLGMADAPQRDKKRLTQALWQMRQTGQVDDCWRHDRSRRHMGNLLILWTHPRPDTSGAFKAEDF